MKRPQLYHRRVICIPFEQDQYDEIVMDPVAFREHLDRYYSLNPEPFPEDFEKGYKMKDLGTSSKLGITVRRITVGSTAYTIRPSFVTPYMTAWTDDIEDALFLRKFDVPFWAIALIFGKYAMYWHRLECSLGRNSVVGTTVQAPEKIPKDLGADEKHSRCCGEKVYVTTTVGEECILGVSIAEKASNEEILEGYSVFKEEALDKNTDYSPRTVNTDGYLPTRTAWQKLFPAVALITCFLHIFIKLRDGAKKKFKSIFEEVAGRLWECYRAKCKASFSQRVRRLHEWSVKKSHPERMQKTLGKLRSNLPYYSRAYDYPGAHRTSNMLDRLMRKMDRHLFNTVYLHGSLEVGELSLRGWALIQNFAPLNPETVKKYEGKLSRAERLNGYRYHESWLQNLLISASLGGYRSPPQNS